MRSRRTAPPVSDARSPFTRSRGVPLMLQQERSECGLACVAMIAAYFGRQENLQAVRSMAGGASRGSTLKDLVDVAQQLKLISRPLRLSLDDLPRLTLPAVLHWKMDHYVVLNKLTRKGANILDPATGKRHIGKSELGRCFTGVALELHPAADFRKGNATSLSLLRIARSFRKLPRFLLLMLALLMVIQLLSLVPAVATQLLIDNIVQGQDREWLFGLLAGMGSVMLAATALEAMRQWVALYAGSRLAADSSSSVLFHLFRLPPDFIQNRQVGGLMSRVESLVPVRRAITEQGISAIVNATVLLTTLAVMCAYSISLAAITLLSACLAAGLLLAIVPPIRRHSAEQIIHAASQNTSLLETLRASTAVFNLGLSNVRLAHWQTHFHASLNAQVKQGRLKILQDSGAGVIQAFDQVLFLGVGISGVLDQSISLGVLFAFFTLRGRFTTSAMTLMATVQSFMMLRVHIQRLSDIVLAEPTAAPVAGAMQQRLRGAVAAKDIRFRYSPDTWILDGFDFDVDAGASVVIAGPSGGGKTTLLKLLSGQLVPDSGQLQYDGYDYDLWHPDKLRGQFGVVSQDDALFQGTVVENICCFDPQPDLARVRQVATMSELWRDIQAMPMRLHTLVGDMGCSLSGGQRQRLCLARALYRKPRVLFLDEATSHLDAGTEERILDRLSDLEITTISVAHRPDIIRRAQRVIIVGNTKIANP